jgi:hypothetical protein
VTTPTRCGCGLYQLSSPNVVVMPGTCDQRMHSLMRCAPPPPNFSPSQVEPSFICTYRPPGAT